MVAIHIFVRTPLSATLMIAVGVGPWAAVCITGSYIGTVTICLLSLLYVLMLLSQLWPIRTELTDAVPHAGFCVLGKPTAASRRPLAVCHPCSVAQLVLCRDV